MGSNPNRAQREAQAAEDQRRREIAETQRRIESIFSDPSRDAGIRDVEEATRAYLTQDLDRQNKRSARELKFALARDGQTMGSVDVDRNRDLSEGYLRGAIEVQRRANAAGNSLRQADQTSKQNLFALAQSGLDMTTAVRQASQTMQANLAGAKTDALQSGLGDLFGDLGAVYKRSRERAGADRAERYQYGTFYQPNAFYSGMGGGAGSGWNG